MSEGVKSAVRTLAILDAFDRERRPLALKDITEMLGYPASSASAIVKSLVDLGYLAYDRAGRTYLPTMRVALLGRWAEEAWFGKVHFAHPMEALHEQTGEAVILAAQSDLHAQYLHIVYSDEPLQFRAEPGLKRSLVRSGVGWALLAAQPDAEILRLRERIDAYGIDRIGEAELMDRIHETRALGYAFSRHTMSEGVGLIAMTLPQAPFGRPLALAVAGYVSRLERNESAIVAQLRRTIALLSESIDGECP
ncbi:IclR family transcriptional regulator [Novosphingobium bradum]|uniref:IclR family transcriptional regulator n=1 Tax=Novosphingobium bradum TaxID=1737444 RepID=A0ABV7IPG7_9SPHN